MKDPDNIRKLAELQPDYMGLIFYPQSKRFAGDMEATTLDTFPRAVKRTGVFVNEAMDTIADQVIKYDLDAVQLHGDESPDFCRSLRKFLHNMQTEKHVEIIKAFGIYDQFDFAVLAGYEDMVDYFLFDTKSIDYGGSGLTFDWAILDNYHGKKPYFLSGGLSADNIDRINEIKDVRFYGVDLNSKFETEPGVKDINKLKSVFERIRS
ncbi:MAG: phosphoribosylanthranilate isomerase [Bacteroidota bacterium]